MPKPDPNASIDQVRRAAQAPGRDHSRRQFLTWLVGGSLAAAIALAFGQIARFFSFEPATAAPAVIPVGKPADYPAGALTYVEAARAYVGHDSQGLYAIDAVCTHLGCLVEHETDDGFACPCHGSHFATNGQVQKGPANQALHHLYLELNRDGQVVVDRSQYVTPDTRLTV